MRVLWVTQNGGNYKGNVTKGTGGWIGSLQNTICEAKPDIELGITFFHSSDEINITEKNVTYLPVYYDYGSNNVKKLIIRHFRNEELYINERILEMVSKIRSYQPDIIHVWGLEFFHSRVLEHIFDIPIVVHIQGLLSVSLNSFIPYGFSVEDIRHSDSWFTRNVLKNGLWFSYNEILSRATNEQRVAPLVKNWIGRTQWDRTMAKMLNPNSSYYHCNELMRSDFADYKWSYHYNGKTLLIQTTISADWYKGLDVILKTAKILRDNNINFCWNIYGWSNLKLSKTIARRLGIYPAEVNVKLHGKVDGTMIRNGLMKCDCYVHPSYIENSSNAIAEAQMLGVPVLAQHVGGNETMLKDNSGVLVPPNDPYILADAIMKIRDKEIAEFYSNNAVKLAIQRQNTSTVIESILYSYNQIIRKQNMQ